MLNNGKMNLRKEDSLSSPEKGFLKQIVQAFHNQKSLMWEKANNELDFAEPLL